MIHLSIRRFHPCGRYYGGLQDLRFSKCKAPIPCKHCDNLKMDMAVEITGKDKNQFCPQVIEVLQEACKKCKNR